MNSEKQEKITPCLLYEVTPGARYRVVIRYGEKLRPFFWFKVSKQGDVYLGPRYKKITLLQKNTQQIHGKYSDINYDEGEIVSDPDHLNKGGKVSFHASGKIHFADDHAFRDSLRTLDKQQLLCLAIFEHPGKWATISTLRKRDVYLNYSIDEARPLWAQIYITPHEKFKPVILSSATQQVNLLFEYHNLTGVPDFLLQFIVGHGAAGPWPSKAGLIFRSNYLEGQLSS